MPLYKTFVYITDWRANVICQNEAAHMNCRLHIVYEITHTHVVCPYYFRKRSDYLCKISGMSFC